MRSFSRNMWAMERGALDSLNGTLAGIQPEALAHLSQIEVQAKDPKPAVTILGDTAVIAVHGVLMKSVPWYYGFFDVEATSYDSIARGIEMAMADGRVSRIQLQIDSPGGQVAGCLEATTAIKNAAALKEVVAVIEDCGCSAAYWLASQAGSVVADANAAVGSIGVYCVLYDQSKQADEMGIKAHVIRSGDLKGAGVAGAPISEEQLAAIQEEINALGQNFIEAVATGRRRDISEIQQLATGQSWIAAGALERGLIDDVISYELSHNDTKEIAMDDSQNTAADNAPDQAVTEKPDNTAADAVGPPDVNAVAESTLADERARVKSIKETFGHDPEFALEAIDAGWTVTEAKAERHDRLEASQVEHDGADAQDTFDSKPGPGGNFMDLAEARAREKGISQSQAQRELAHEQPELHQAYVASCLNGGDA